MAKGAESLPVFSRCYANVSVFWREIKETPTYLSSKSKKIRDRVDSRVQLVWRLRVISSCYKYRGVKFTFAKDRLKRKGLQSPGFKDWSTHKMSRSLILPFTKKLGGALNHNVFSEVDQTDLQKFRCPGVSRGILKLRNDRHITSRGRKREDPGNEDVFTRPALARACLTFLRHNLEVSYTWARRVINFYGTLCNCKENFVTDPILESKSKQCPVICQMLTSLWNVKRHA